HGAAGNEFAAQLRFLREELPLEERQALLERWDRVLSRTLPDLLAAEQRESVLLALEAAAAEGAAWAALEDRMPLDQAPDSRQCCGRLSGRSTGWRRRATTR